MKIKKRTKWVIDYELTSAQEEFLKKMGWIWVDAYDRFNDHPFRYGHYCTYDADVVRKTRKAFALAM